MTKKRIIYISAAVVIVAVGLMLVKSCKKTKQTFSFETTKVEKGSVNQVITATGTLEAITTVEVGTQVSGVIEKIYADFNSPVKKGQLLATLDETPLKASLEQSKASVDQAEAEVKYQKSSFERNKALFEKQLIAQSDYDLAEYNYNKAVASLKNARSVYEKNRINLDYARIYSPIDGVVLDRAVDEGQTVAASFNTPTLFTIAQDLTQMQVEANVDEADIGQVKDNQRVEFTVDAFPDTKFDGQVVEVRMQPVETSNVITYTVIINAPNPDMKLLPGMTASTSIYVKEKKDILVVPGKAIRFTPDETQLNTYMASVRGEEMPAPPTDKPVPPAETSATKDQTTVWVKEGALIHPVPVKLGDNDGINYELVEGPKEGVELVLSMTADQAQNQTTTAAKSPFMPQRPKR
jgi:HlyD family secretion protein